MAVHQSAPVVLEADLQVQKDPQEDEALNQKPTPKEVHHQQEDLVPKVDRPDLRLP